MTVTGVDDTIDDGNQDYTVLLAPAVSTDTNYRRRDPEDVSARNVDNEGTPVVTLVLDPASITEGAGETDVTVTATVTGTTTYGAEVTVAVSVAGSGTAGAVGFRATVCTHLFPHAELGSEPCRFVISVLSPVLLFQGGRDAKLEFAFW